MNIAVLDIACGTKEDSNGKKLNIPSYNWIEELVCPIAAQSVTNAMPGRANIQSG